MGKKKQHRFKHALLESLESAKARGLEPATMKSYEYHTRAFLLPALGEKKLSKLEPTDLDRLYRRMKDEGYKPSTVRKCNVTVGLALKLAERRGWVSRNVARIAELPKNEKPNRKIPTPDELFVLLAFAEHRDPEVHDFARVLAATGLRPGEACALRCDDLDWEGTLTIERALDVCQGSARIKSTKTGKTRRLALDADTARIIEKRPGPFVFGGEQPARTDLMSKRFRRVTAAAGLDFTPRSLRHFHATQLIAAGMDLKSVADRLGHSNPTITGSVYIQSVPSRDSRSAELIAGVLAQRPAASVAVSQSPAAETT